MRQHPEWGSPLPPPSVVTAPRGAARQSGHWACVRPGPTVTRGRCRCWADKLRSHQRAHPVAGAPQAGRHSPWGPKGLPEVSLPTRCGSESQITAALSARDGGVEVTMPWGKRGPGMGMALPRLPARHLGFHRTRVQNGRRGDPSHGHGVAARSHRVSHPGHPDTQVGGHPRPPSTPPKVSH